MAYTGHGIPPDAPNRTGKFVVKYNVPGVGYKEANFTELHNALRLYSCLEDAALWDVTTIPELLDSKDGED